VPSVRRSGGGRHLRHICIPQLGLRPGGSGPSRRRSPRRRGSDGCRRRSCRRGDPTRGREHRSLGTPRPSDRTSERRRSSSRRPWRQARAPTGGTFGSAGEPGSHVHKRTALRYSRQTPCLATVCHLAWTAHGPLRVEPSPRHTGGEPGRLDPAPQPLRMPSGSKDGDHADRLPVAFRHQRTSPPCSNRIRTVDLAHLSRQRVGRAEHLLKRGCVFGPPRRDPQIIHDGDPSSWGEVKVDLRTLAWSTVADQASGSPAPPKERSGCRMPRQQVTRTPRRGWAQDRRLPHRFKVLAESLATDHAGNEMSMHGDAWKDRCNVPATHGISWA
jgi:hypothetical protein